jgi:hypothetical protein
MMVFRRWVSCTPGLFGYGMSTSLSLEPVKRGSWSRIPREYILYCGPLDEALRSAALHHGMAPPTAHAWILAPGRPTCPRRRRRRRPDLMILMVSQHSGSQVACVDKQSQNLAQGINAFDVADVFLPALLLGVHLLLDVAERVPWPIAIRKATSTTLAPFQQFLSLQDFKDNLGMSLKPASWKTRGLAVLASIELASQLASLVYIFTTSRTDLILPALTGTAVWVSLLCHIEFAHLSSMLCSAVFCCFTSPPPTQNAALPPAVSMDCSRHLRIRTRMRLCHSWWTCYAMADHIYCSLLALGGDHMACGNTTPLA